MDSDFESSNHPNTRRYGLFVLGAVVVAAAVFLGISLTSSTPLPVEAASYQCVPGSLIPQLKPGQSSSIHASYGGFTATFHATMPAHANPNGPVVGTPFKGTLTMTHGAQSWALPGPALTLDTQINAMCVIAFQPEQHPGVMIEGFTGGAHCCEVPVIYRFDATHDRYVKVVDMSPKHPKNSYVFDANEGFIPEVVGNVVLLTTGDDGFSYAFGCYACSATPLLLYSVDPDGLADVSSKYPALIAAHAHTLLQRAMAAVRAESAVETNIPAPFGLLAPWVADECEIGRGASAFATIERLAHEGKLSNALYYKATLDRGSFVLNLRSFLLSDAYCTGQI